MRTTTFLLAIGVALLVGLDPAHGAAEDARQILDRRRLTFDTEYAWSDKHQVSEVTITDRQGNSDTRTLDIFGKRYPDGTMNLLLSFSAPPMIKGTAILIHTSDKSSTEQWLYIPALKRARRIAPRMRDESFVGTDLTHGDLEILDTMVKWTEADARATLKGNVVVDATPTFEIALAPQRNDVSYGTILTWIGCEDLISRRLELYDKQGELQKLLLLSDIRKVGRIPVPYNLQVATVKSGTTTVFAIRDIRFDIGFADSIFSLSSLGESTRGYDP